MYYSFIRKALSQFDPERTHEFVLRQLRRITGTPLESMVKQKIPEKPITCMGLNFKNPVGLAAGLDKNSEYVDILGSVGFGSIEIGTVTPRPQEGNNKPRLFLLLEADGLINRMGFNNFGVDYLVNNIKKIHYNDILGINIGINQDTPLEKAKDDYLICMEKVYSYASYIAINVSSPNTPNLRTLQYGELLDDLLISIKNKQNQLQQLHHKYVPVALKISPDLSEEELIHISDSLLRYKIDGVIATNTTLDKFLVRGMKHCNEKGGVSGRPVQLKSTEIIRSLSKELKGRLPIIGVGGIDSVISAREKIAAGASLLQIYSSFIFKGPSLIHKIVSQI